MKKNVIALLIVLVAVGIVGGGIYYSQTQKAKQQVISLQGQITKLQGEVAVETPVVPADWKTYVNAEYGFEIIYPESLTAGEYKPSDTESLIVGFLGKNDQAFLVSIRKFATLEEVSNMLTNKYYKRDGYYLAISGFANNVEADQIISTFKFTK